VSAIVGTTGSDLVQALKEQKVKMANANAMGILVIFVKYIIMRNLGKLKNDLKVHRGERCGNNLVERWFVFQINFFDIQMTKGDPSV
jgi:hypothetical protein